MKNKKPAIRFKGFSEEWEECELKDLCAIITKQTGFDYSATIKPSLITESSQNTYSFIQNKDFSGTNINLNTDYHIPKDIANAFPNILIDKPSILISISGKIGNVGFYKKIDKAFIGGAVGICKLINEPDGLIILYQLVSNLGQNYFQSLTKASSHLNITVEDIRKISIKIPSSNNEKVQIGNFFKNLDSFITLHQQKYDKLVNVKKAMLEKMFPKNGADVPEIRFKGFEGAWEENRLGDVAEFNPKSELPEKFLYVDLESVVGTEMIAHREESKDSAPSRAQRLARKGDLFYQTVRPYQKNNYLFDKSSNNYVFSTGYAQMRPHGDGYFLLCLVQNNGFVKLILDRCTGTSYPAINSTDLADTKVFIPINKEEQEKIGNYFKNLDNLLTLHEGELTKLKNLKKAMLEKMFV